MQSTPRRRIGAPVYLSVFLSFAALLLLDHSIYLGLPYFWDELGQFVPAALDILHDGALVPHSAVPNVHPPGVMLFLALVWKTVGYSVPATRVAMLTFAAAGAVFCFLLAIQLGRGLGGVPAFVAILLLFVDPLFFSQSMMAQLDMPAMVLTLAGLLLFLQDRHLAAGLASTALVLCKETGIVLPFVLGLALLLDRKRDKQAAFYVAPFIVLAAWLALLWHSTGHIFGDPGFAHYNIGYALHPVRVVVSFARRLYYLFVADFRWIGTITILYGLKRSVFSRPGWRITTIFAAAHVLLVSLFGGAELERYLLPVLPLFYIAAAAAWTVLPLIWRNVSLVVLTLGLLAGMFVNPPYPFPFENNLAMSDFVLLHQSAARFLERSYANREIYTAWPLTAALRKPEYGYVTRGLTTVETSDLHVSTLKQLDPKRVKVLVLYSRTWEPGWSVLRSAAVRNFLAQFYEYEPQMSAVQCFEQFGLRPVGRWTRRGQWIEVYATEQPLSSPSGEIASPATPCVRLQLLTLDTSGT